MRDKNIDILIGLYDIMLNLLQEALDENDYNKLMLVKSALSELRASLQMDTAIGVKLYQLYSIWYNDLKDFEKVEMIMKELAVVRKSCIAAFEGEKDA